MQHPQEKDRWIKVSWDPDSLNTYKTSLDLIAKDRPGLAMDITTVMAQRAAAEQAAAEREASTALDSSKINILGMNVNVLPDGYAKMNLVVEVDSEHPERGDITIIQDQQAQPGGVEVQSEVSRVSG